jgi:LPPG:FO 2-phospho-L-lactate transferase
MKALQESVLALSGGVGGAKLALGLADVLPPGQLHVLANTGDDFRHLGLHISPDIDTWRAKHGV